MKNHYATLELPSNASAGAIKKAYQKLAMKFHPDKNKEKEATAKFQEIGAAYEILGDPQKKAAYDANNFQSLPRPQASATPGSSSNSGSSARGNQDVCQRFYNYVGSHYIDLCSHNTRIRPEILKTLESFIAEGLDVNYKYSGHNGSISLLHMAIINNEVEFARKLILAGADRDAVMVGNDRTHSPFLAAFDYMRDSEFLSELITNKTILTSAHLLKSLELKKYLFMEAIIQESKKRGTFDTLINYDQTTMLHKAASINLREGAILLINAGADINALSYLGNTPLHVSLNNKHFKMAQELINLGANVTIFNNKRETPLHLAVQYKEKGVIEAIISAAARTNNLDQVVEDYLEDRSKANTHMAIASRLTANPEDLLNLAKFQKLTALSDFMDHPEVLLQAMDRINRKKTEERSASPAFELDIEGLEKFCESPRGKRKLEERSVSGYPSPTTHNKASRKNSPERKQQL